MVNKLNDIMIMSIGQQYYDILIKNRDMKKCIDFYLYSGEKYKVKDKKQLRALIEHFGLLEKSEYDGEDLSWIDTSEVTDMSSLFVIFREKPAIKYSTKFNIPLPVFAMPINNAFNCKIGNWDVSNVVNMESMFEQCNSFNQDLSNWNVSKVTNMNSMFYGCDIYNQPMVNWDVSNVTDFSHQFAFCDDLMQDFRKWDVKEDAKTVNTFNFTKMVGDNIDYLPSKFRKEFDLL